MWQWVVWVTVAVVLGGGAKAGAELYLWTDEQGVVHMTNQWAMVPESARTRVSVRDSTPPSSEAPTVAEPAVRPVEPSAVRPTLAQTPPDLQQVPPTATSPPSRAPNFGDSSALIPNSRPRVHRHKSVSPPFPYDVRLDPVDQNSVWVGRNRVPKDTFTYPRVSLDAQAQFRNRLRSLEQRRGNPPGKFQTPSMRP